MALAGLAGIRAQHGIVESRTRVVPVDVQVVMGVLVGVDGLQVEGSLFVVGSGQEGTRCGCCHRRGEQGQGCEEVHYDYFGVYV